MRCPSQNDPSLNCSTFPLQRALLHRLRQKPPHRISSVGTRYRGHRRLSSHLSGVRFFGTEFLDFTDGEFTLFQCVRNVRLFALMRHCINLNATTDTHRRGLQSHSQPCFGLAGARESHTPRQAKSHSNYSLTEYAFCDNSLV